MKKESPPLNRRTFGNCPRPVERSSSEVQILARTCTWAEWEAGRAARRALALTITGGKILRRRAGNPGKDILLRRLNRGERGLPFRSMR